MEDQIKAGRLDRQEKVQNIIDKLDGTNALILNDYRGLTVTQIAELRAALRKSNSSMHVHKNKLAKIAMKKENYPEELIGYLNGPTAITYVKGDVSVALKEIFEFVKKDYPIEVRGVLSDNEIFDAKQAKMLSTLPSREQLLSMLMSTMNAPVQKMASGLNEIVAQLARLLQAVADSKKE